MSKAKLWECPMCGKKSRIFEGAMQHLEAKHPKRHPEVLPRYIKRGPPDDDRSFADIAVEAHLKRLMGEPLDVLEESLLTE